MEYIRDVLVALLITAAAVGIVALPVRCTMARNELTAQATKDGAEPIAARCAIEGWSSQNLACAIHAARTATPSK